MSEKKYTVKGSAGMLATIPALLGTTPTESAVVILLAEGRVEVTFRVDLSHVAADALTPVLADLGRKLPDVDGASVVIVSEELDPMDAYVSASVIADALESVGIDLSEYRGEFHVPTLAAGQRYTDLTTGKTGTMIDPRISDTSMDMHRDNGVDPADTEDELAAALAPVGDPVRPSPLMLSTLTEVLGRVAATLLSADTVPDTMIAQIGAHMTVAQWESMALEIIDATRPAEVTAALAAAIPRLGGDARVVAGQMLALAYYATGQAVRSRIALEAVDRVLTDRKSRLMVTLLQVAAPPSETVPAMRKIIAESLA